MDAIMRYDPNKAEVSPMKEPLRWVCNEFFHDLKRRVDPSFTNTVEQDAGLAFGAGAVSAIGIAEALKYGVLPKVQQSFYNMTGAELSIDNAILAGLGAAALFGAWYFRPSKNRQEYLSNHNVYPEGVKGVLGGAGITGLVELSLNHPDAFIGTIDMLKYID